MKHNGISPECEESGHQLEGVGPLGVILFCSSWGCDNKEVNKVFLEKCSLSDWD